MTNPHPARFLQLLAEADGPALDVGSGARRLPGVVSLEYFTHPGVDVVADGQALPFRSGTFSVVLCQAVVEHVTDPHVLVAELARVLRPGGALWIEGAFMQPVHQQPLHFFNVTPFGLRLLAERAGLVVEELALLGTYAEVVRWMAREADVPPPARIPTPSPDRYFNVASGVALLGRKP